MKNDNYEDRDLEYKWGKSIPSEIKQNYTKNLAKKQGLFIKKA